jgi:serine/threonine protein kinase/tetratricopeptide (TPR) repeat protein
MEPERFRELDALFRQAVSMAPSSRAAFLARTCGDDDALRDRLERMLAFDEDLTNEATRGHLGRVVVHAAARVVDCGNEPESRPAQIGEFRITDVLGEGGMGVVYLAEQRHPKRPVALKLVRSTIVSPRMIRRFEFEAEVLARLKHPGIAQIYGAGAATVDGRSRPFFAMELVDGRPLTHFADKRNLDARERLKLLVRICRAVQHAHQQGVVHRDLKPSNILVTDDGEPKILDFGVARLVDAEVQLTSIQTDVNQLIGTLPYMSPEQVSANASQVDVRSDVYALGVVLYELLTGALPHDLAGQPIPRAASIICTEAPAPLSADHRQYKGDLETIVGKALEKDRDRRYQSASELAADVERYLNDKPIEARPPSVMYQMRKFARRNRGLVGSATATVLVLIAAVVGMTTLAFSAHREAEVATTISMFLQDMLGAPDPLAMTGDTGAARDVRVVDVLDRAMQLVNEEYGDQPEIEAVIRVALGRTYTGLGAFDKAELNLTRALAIYEQREPPDGSRLLDCRSALALLHLNAGRAAEAESMWRETLGIRLDTVGPDDPATLRCMHGLGTALWDQSRYDEAEELLTAAYEGRADALGSSHVDTLLSMHNLGVLYRDQGRLDEAERTLSEALTLMRDQLSVEHPHTLSALNTLADVYRQMDRHAEAEELFREAIARRTHVLGAEHPDTLESKSNLALLLHELGRFDEAEPIMRETLDARRRVIGLRHRATLITMNNLGLTLKAQGRYDEAEPVYLEALQRRREVLGDNHPDTVQSMNNLGMLYMTLRRFDDAEPLLEEAYARHLAERGAEHPETSTAQQNLAMLYVEQERYDEAEPLYREALRSSELVYGPDHSATIITMSNLATMYRKQGRNEEAEPLCARVVDGMRALMPDGHRYIGITLANHGQCLTKLGRYAEAESALNESWRILKESLGEQHDRTKLVLKYLAELYTAWGREDLAIEYRTMHASGDTDAD